MNKLLGLFSKSAPMREVSHMYDLKSRLDWGEPALTILDVRDRGLFNESHIQGAISMPTSVLIARAQETLELDRDLYVYASTDEDAISAAQQLRHVGYRRVSVLRGGVAAWKAVGFPVEANTTAV